jgi:hypothetical protein
MRGQISSPTPKNEANRYFSKSHPRNPQFYRNPQTVYAHGGAGKLVKCYDIVEKYFPQVKVKNA